MAGKTSFFTEISRNKRNSILLVFLVFFILAALVYVIALALAPGAILIILPLAGIIIIVHALTSYYAGDKIVLSTVKAYDPDPTRHIFLINTVEGLAIAAGLPTPKIKIMPSKEINAFATGRDPKHATICVTEGALEKLNRQELEGVIAHEMSHVGNYDIRFFMFVAIFVGLIAIISHIFLRSMMFGGGRSRGGKNDGAIFLVIGLILAIVAPIVVRLVQLSISRKREYLADATGAKLTRYPEGLASALEKIGQVNAGKMKISEAESHMFIADPKKSFADNLFATHPPIEKRVARLRAM